MRLISNPITTTCPSISGRADFFPRRHVGSNRIPASFHMYRHTLENPPKSVYVPVLSDLPIGKGGNPRQRLHSPFSHMRHVLECVNHKYQKIFVLTAIVTFSRCLLEKALTDYQEVRTPGNKLYRMRSHASVTAPSPGVDRSL